MRYNGRKAAVRIPPATSSKIIFGMLFATLYADAIRVFPSANAIAHVRNKPVMRERSVAAVISMLERAIELGVAVSLTWNPYRCIKMRRVEGVSCNVSCWAYQVNILV